MTLKNTTLLPVITLLAIGALLAGCDNGSNANKSNTAPAVIEDDSPLKVLEMPRTPAPEGAAVFFTNIKDGDTVTSPVTLQFGAKNIDIVTAGVYDPGTGHHHLIIDAELPPMNLAFPADANHIHFGGGQLETVVELEPGNHTLQLLVGDGNHVPLDPPVLSERITITVE